MFTEFSPKGVFLHLLLKWGKSIKVVFNERLRMNWNLTAHTFFSIPRNLFFPGAPLFLISSVLWEYGPQMKTVFCEIRKWCAREEFTQASCIVTFLILTMLLRYWFLKYRLKYDEHVKEWCIQLFCILLSSLTVFLRVFKFIFCLSVFISFDQLTLDLINYSA